MVDIEDVEEEYRPVRFSWSHFEFFGLMWLSHHQEYKRLDSECNIVAITPAKNSSKAGFDLAKAWYGIQARLSAYRCPPAMLI